MHDGLVRIDKITRRLLSLTRDRPPRFEPVGLDDLLSDVLGLTCLHANQRSVDLDMSAEFSAPVLLDADRLVEALSCVVTNAIDASEARGRVTLRALRMDGAASGFAIEVRDDRREIRFLLVLEESIDHHVADELNVLTGDSLLLQVLQPRTFADEEEVGYRVGEHTIDLLGHTPIVGAEPGLDVDNPDAGLRRHQRARDGGVDVSDHHDGSGALGLENLFEAHHNLGGLPGVRSGPHL